MSLPPDEEAAAGRAKEWGPTKPTPSTANGARSGGGMIWRMGRRTTSRTPSATTMRIGTAGDPGTYADAWILRIRSARNVKLDN